MMFARVAGWDGSSGSLAGVRVRGLTDVEVHALAAACYVDATARDLLQAAGLPQGEHPPWDRPRSFWREVSRLLAAGVLVDGRARLLAAAAAEFPDNPVFTAAVGADGASGRVWGGVPERLARFVGRDGLLAEVHQALSGSARVALVALDGMGGVGKTAVAAEYAHRYADAFDVVWWVPAERAELVDQHLTGLAGPLGLPSSADAGAVWSALRSVGSWLVVFDNVEQVEAVARFRPSGGGRVLVTSRRRAVRALGRAVPVPPLDRKASVELFAQRVPGIDEAVAGQIAGMLGDLPLAVEQSAGFLDETEIPVEEYAELLAGQFEVMLDRGRVLDRPEQTVANLWALSVDRLRDDCPAAVELLELCAWCDAEPVPLTLLAKAPDRLGDGLLAAAAADPAVWADTVGALVGYSLARRDGDALVVHRLVAAATRRATAPERAADRLAVLAGLLRATLPEQIMGSPDGWPAWWILLAHVLAVVERLRTASGQPFDDGSWLADRAATFLQEHGQLDQAVPIFEQTLTDRERVLGTDHPHTLTSRHNLAGSYWRAGRLDQAISLYEQTLADRERVLGTDHPDTLSTRNNLAGAYETAGRLDQAIPLFEQTLADRRRVLGTDHPHTLASRSYLAGAYRAAGRLDQAIPLFEQTLADYEVVFGPDHPHTLASRNNLAYAYRAAGRLDQAIPLHEQTLTDRERVLGTDHPNTLTSRSYLAGAYRAAGRLDQAIPLHEQTLTDRERVLGTDHPDTLTSRNNLAHAYETAGRLDQAIPLYEQTLADGERVLEASHPFLATFRANLARARSRAE